MIGLWIAGVSAALAAQGDDLNYRYVDCMFAVSRAAPVDMRAQELSALLRRSCTQERGALHSIMLEIRTQRGASRAQAESDWRQLEVSSVASIVAAHERVGAVSR